MLDTIMPTQRGAKSSNIVSFERGLVSLHVPHVLYIRAS
jgi:hypothetical protein